MATLVIEHIKASDLPAQWALKLNAAPEHTVTVRIETEASSEAAGKKHEHVAARNNG